MGFDSTIVPYFWEFVNYLLKGFFLINYFNIEMAEPLAGEQLVYALIF
jgi:hypothetical protein